MRRAGWAAVIATVGEPAGWRVRGRSALLLVNPGRPITSQTSAVRHIVAEEIVDAARPEAAARMLRAPGERIVAHSTPSTGHGLALNDVSLSDLYRAYIDCLNRRDWGDLGRHVDDDVEHNGRPLGLDGYREMLRMDFETIPDLRFTIGLLVCEPPRVAARLAFRCSPRDGFLGLPVDGRTVSFTENVFYEYSNARIQTVWSIIDKAAIEAQLPR